MKKRILFLMSDTGGGHRSAAQAIEEAVHNLYPYTYKTFIEDIWRFHTPWPVNRIPYTYPWLTGPGLPLWRFMWTGSARLKAHKLVLPGVSPVLQRKVTNYLEAVQPNLIVSVHPLMNHLGLRWLDKMKLDIPFVTVITDMVTIHPSWICPQVTCCIVPTEEAGNSAIKLGMPPEKVEVYGQPVGMKFANISVEKAIIRQILGLVPNRATILILGGGEGFGRVFEIARTIAQTVSEVQLLIVAGRNTALKTKLETGQWEVPTKIYGFVDNMAELMGAADILITKAGPSTISEAFTTGLPLLLSGYIPGQEQGNVTYVEQHRAGAYAETPAEIAQIVSTWLDPNNATLQEMARNAARLAKPEASLSIATKVCSLIPNNYSTRHTGLCRDRQEKLEYVQII